MSDFYDDLAASYHLLFEDWDASLRRQGEQLPAVLRAEWRQHRRVLDVACGIGTQSIALEMNGYRVTGSDLSARQVERAGREAAARGLSIDFSVCDMCAAHAHHGSGFDLVICADNSLPHLLDDAQILTALQQMHACLRPGGGCLITLRDYALEPRGRNIVKPYGVRIDGTKRHLLFQVWDFDGDCYDLTLFHVEEDSLTQAVSSRALHSRYYAVSTDTVCALLQQAGFQDVRRLDSVFYQPVLVGTKAPGP